MTSNNRYASRLFRNEVVLHLHSEGIYTAGTLTAEELAAVPLRSKEGLITGLPWTVMTRVDRGPISWSAALDDAEALANHFGSDRYAVVLHRRLTCHRACNSQPARGRQHASA